jgi:hypothetical protein
MPAAARPARADQLVQLKPDVVALQSQLDPQAGHHLLHGGRPAVAVEQAQQHLRAQQRPGDSVYLLGGH